MLNEVAKQFAGPEEITAALARIPDLRVVARESAFRYKDQKKDVRAVGHALGAGHVIEGSVRKVGSRVRITARLVKASDGVNVWTDSYDRELTDIFAIQEEIATTIARALSVPLGLKPGQHLVSNRSADQEAYELYLRGRLALRMPSRAELNLLEQVVARDPNFAPGWAKLSEARREIALDFERRGDVSRRPLLVEGAEAAAKKAIALDPEYAGGYAALAGAYSWSGKWAKAIELAKQGLALDPEESELLNNYSHTLHALGFLKNRCGCASNWRWLNLSMRSLIAKQPNSCWRMGRSTPN